MKKKDRNTLPKYPNSLTQTGLMLSTGGNMPLYPSGNDSNPSPERAAEQARRRIVANNVRRGFKPPGRVEPGSSGNLY